VSDAPAEFIAALLGAIVGVEIPIARLAGKWKASQNRTGPDKRGVIAGLEKIDSDDAHDMAALIERVGGEG
jgi:transcriptional regulator